MENQNKGANTGFNGSGKGIEGWEHLGPTHGERLETIPGLIESEHAVDILSRNKFSNTKAYEILNNGSSRLNGGFEIAKHSLSHAEKYNQTTALPEAQIAAMSKYNNVQDGYELIAKALDSLKSEKGVDTGLAKRIIEDCRDRTGTYGASLAKHYGEPASAEPKTLEA